MSEQVSSSTARRSLLAIVGSVILLFAAAATPAAAQGQKRVQVFAVTIFGIQPTGAFQVIDEGYDSGLIYAQVGDAIEPQSGGILVKRNGIYQIQLEAGLFFDPRDASAPPSAGALFAVLTNGEANFVCATPPKKAGLDDPAFGRVAVCSVHLTQQVRGQGTPPFVLPRNTLIQAAIIPNGPVGDNTQAFVRLEITRLGN